MISFRQDAWKSMIRMTPNPGTALRVHSEQRHGAAMAPLILHGDLNNLQPRVRHRLYVRPVMFPQGVGFGIRDENRRDP